MRGVQLVYCWWPAALMFIFKNPIQTGILQEGKKYSTGCVFVESKGSGIFREYGKHGFYLDIMTGGRGDKAAQWYNFRKLR